MSYIPVPLIYLWVFWGFYVLVMGFYRAHLDKRLTKLTYVLAAPFIITGIVLDVLAQLTIATLAFLEIPREWLVTSRLSRLINSNAGWRTKLADFICTRVLDPFDPTGKHCK